MCPYITHSLNVNHTDIKTRKHLTKYWIWAIYADVNTKCNGSTRKML